jgi:hypothetical protein
MTKEKSEYYKLNEEALDRILWIRSLGRGYGPVVRQTRELIYVYIYICIYICVCVCVCIYIYIYVCGKLHVQQNR